MAAIDAQVAAVDERRGELSRGQQRLEDEIASLNERAAQAEKRLYSGAVSNPRELQALQDDVASIRRRIGQLEDQELEIMELSEPIDAQRAELGVERERLEAETERLTVDLTVAEAEIAAELEAVRSERDKEAAGVPAELWAEYDRLRLRLDGVAIARLVGTTCQGCHLQLSAVEIDRIRRLDRRRARALRGVWPPPRARLIRTAVEGVRPVRRWRPAAVSSVGPGARARRGEPRLLARDAVDRDPPTRLVGAHRSLGDRPNLPSSAPVERSVVDRAALQHLLQRQHDGTGASDAHGRSRLLVGAERPPRERADDPVRGHRHPALVVHEGLEDTHGGVGHCSEHAVDGRQGHRRVARQPVVGPPAHDRPLDATDVVTGRSDLDREAWHRCERTPRPLRRTGSTTRAAPSSALSGCGSRSTVDRAHQCAPG